MSFVFINCTAETFTPTKSGAIATWIWEVCRAARKQGVEPWVISRRTDAQPYQWQRTILLDYPRIPTWKGVGRLLRIQQYFSGWGHPRQGAYVEAVVRELRKSGLFKLPLILQNDPEMAVAIKNAFPGAFILHHAQNNNVCAEWFRRRFANAVDVATAVTDFCAGWNARYFERSVSTMLSGVDAERFSPPVSVSHGVPVINFVGRTDPPKAPDLLLKAALKVATRTTRFSLQILGRNYYDRFVADEYQATIERLAAELEDAGVRVRRPGWVDRSCLPDELRKAHIHVVPARWDEPFGLTTLEGMATGLATIASRTGGTPEVIGEAGLLFERDSVNELADHIELLVQSGEERSRYALLARERAKSLSWDRTFEQLWHLLSARR